MTRGAAVLLLLLVAVAVAESVQLRRRPSTFDSFLRPNKNGRVPPPPTHKARRPGPPLGGRGKPDSRDNSNNWSDEESESQEGSNSGCPDGQEVELLRHKLAAMMEAVTSACSTSDQGKWADVCTLALEQSSEESSDEDEKEGKGGKTTKEVKKKNKIGSAAYTEDGLKREDDNKGVDDGKKTKATDMVKKKSKIGSAAYTEDGVKL